MTNLRRNSPVTITYADGTQETKKHSEIHPSRVSNGHCTKCSAQVRWRKHYHIDDFGKTKSRYVLLDREGYDGQEHFCS